MYLISQMSSADSPSFTVSKSIVHIRNNNCLNSYLLSNRTYLER